MPSHTCGSQNQGAPPPQCARPATVVTAGSRPCLQITVTDSHGGRHKELVKSGNDDLRQDAVMQQFFKLVNYVLQADAATRKRQLGIRTYKVLRLPSPPPHHLPISFYQCRCTMAGCSVE